MATMVVSSDALGSTKMRDPSLDNSSLRNEQCANGVYSSKRLEYLGAFLL